MNTKVIALVVVLLLVLAGLLWWLPITPKATPATDTTVQVEDTTEVINTDLDAIQLDTGGTDFMDVDKDLQSL